MSWPKPTGQLTVAQAAAVAQSVTSLQQTGGVSALPIVLAAFGGSAASPVSPAIGGGGVLYGKFGLPIPFIKIPANTIPAGGAVLEATIIVNRTGTLASQGIACRFGPNNGSFDPTCGSPSITTTTNPNRGVLTWRIALGATTAESLVGAFLPNTGTAQAFAEVPFNPAVDNYVSFDCTGTSAKAASAVIGAGKGGTGYSVNDVLTVVGGSGTAATLTVTTVSAGVITNLGVTTGGSYTAVPANYTGDVAVTGGGGTGATPTITWTGDSVAIIGGEVILNVAPSQAANVNLVSSPIPVPTTFFGLNSQVWPVSGSAPILSYGTFCTFGTTKLHWNSLQTGAGALSATIGDFDTTLNTIKAAGAQMNFTFYGCPTAFASTGSSTAGAWGALGEGAYCGNSNLAQVTYFLGALIARANANQDGIIKTIQLWNEPDFTQTPGATGFWGTAAQFVDLLYTAYAAIKAADPRIIVLCPGTFDLTNANYGLNQWINATGGVNTTKHGYDCFDAIAAHPYHARPQGQLYSGVGDILGLSLGGILPFRSALASYKSGTVDYYITEYGVSSGYDSELQQFLAATAAYRKSFISRLLIDCMIYGVKLFGLFGFGPSQAPLSGDLTNDTTGVIAGWNATYAACAGKTITSGGFVSDGSRYLNFSDGTSYLA